MDEDEQSEKLEVFNRKYKKNQTEMKNTTTEIKKYTGRNQQYIRWYREMN